MCYLSTEFFTSHSESKLRKFSLASFTRKLEAFGFHRSNAEEGWVVCVYLHCVPGLGGLRSSPFQKLMPRQWQRLSYYTESEKGTLFLLLSRNYANVYRVPQAPVLWARRTSESNFVCVLSHFSRVQLFATQWTITRQAPLSMGILQARILGWVVTPSSRGSSSPRDRTHVSYVFLPWQVGSLPPCLE